MIYERKVVKKKLEKTTPVRKKNKLSEWCKNFHCIEQPKRRKCQNTLNVKFYHALNNLHLFDALGISNVL